ncbi:hypothetical protein BH11BAC3_BH11BAC3_15560 [soil metagenome]
MNIPKLPGVNGLRAFSIGLVVVHHIDLQYKIFKPLIKIPWLRPLLDFISDGQLGVSIFFVISGFLITSIMLHEEKATGTVSLKQFYIRRTLRIFPAYYFMLIVYACLQLTGYLHLPKESWLTAITYTKYFNWKADWYTRHAWSLSIEEHFYIFWPMIFLLEAKIRKSIAFLLILLVPAIRLFIFYHPVSWINELTIFTRVDAIAVGCICALYKNEILKRIIPHFALLFLSSLLILFFLRDIEAFSQKIHIGFIFIPLGLTHGSIANILIAIILMYSVFGKTNTWHKLLNLSLMNYIGVLSYSIYLWQEIFLFKGKHWTNQLPQNIFMIFLTALCSYYLIEKPFLTLKSKFSGNQITSDLNTQKAIV